MHESRPIVFIIIINIAVFLLWMLWGLGQAEPSFMMNNFTVSWEGLAQGRLWVLLTSAFSHNMFWHLFINMYVFINFAPIVAASIGASRFFKFYIFAALMSSSIHSLVSMFMLHQPQLSALGASGAISGVVFLFCLMYPAAKIFILGIIPVPAVLGALLILGLDVWGLITQIKGHGLPIGHGAHLGGALYGILYFFVKIHRPVGHVSGNSPRTE